MKGARVQSAIVLAGCLWCSVGEARARIDVELLGGAPANLRSRIEVRQDGFEALAFTASFRTRPFAFPIYYAVRVTAPLGAASWSAELLHHKVYLRNPPDEIQDFSVSHGFNLLTVQRTWMVRGLRVHAGGGTVVAHPESRVRGRRFDESSGVFGSGYHFAGPVLTAGAARRLAMGATGRMFAVLEGRATFAPVTVPIADGEASFTSIVFHGMFGLGRSF